MRLSLLIASVSCVDPFLLNLLHTDGQADALIKFTPLPTNIITMHSQQTGLSRSQRARLLVDRLQEYAEEQQKRVRELLDREGQEYEVLWINNSIRVKGLRSELVMLMQQEQTVGFRLLPDRIVAKPIEVKAVASEGEQWNLTMIKADRVWDCTRGEGIIVGHIDTGVNLQHPSLESTWTGAWLDPQPDVWRERSEKPDDKNGHGTPTLASAVGLKVGVAPAAKWIACRGCGELGCPEGALLACAQWMLCPQRDARGECELIPHVISNSWGGPIGHDDDDPFLVMLQTWTAIDIVPVFAQGNEGPDCLTASQPALHPLAIAVGSVNQAGQVSNFSSRGPSPIQPWLIKPDLVAPGESIISADHATHGYRRMSGTSMACPQVAGVIALMLSVDPKLRLEEIRTILQQTAMRSLVKSPPLGGPLQCGSIEWDAPINNHYGHGLIDAEAAMKRVTNTKIVTKKVMKQVANGSKLTPPQQMRQAQQKQGDQQKRNNWLKRLFPWWLSQFKV